MEGDRQLIAGALTGDSPAWSALVDRYKRLVYSIPFRYSIPEDACEDIFQEVFTLLLKNLDKLRDADRIAKWLMVTTHRECWRWSNRQNRARVDERTQQPIAEAAADDQLERWEQNQQVRQALDELGGQCKRLLEALYLGQVPMEYAEVARTLGISVGSIGPTRRRCLTKLARLLEDLH